MLFLSSFPPPSGGVTLVDACQAFGRKFGKMQQSVRCFTDILNVVFSGDWKYISRNSVCSVSGKESWWRTWGDDGQCEGLGHAGCMEQQGKGFHEGKRPLCMGSRPACCHHPSALHQPVCNLSADAQEIAQRDRIHKGNSCKWCSWTEEQKESWWHLLGALCWPAARMVLGKLSTGVTCSQSSLIQLLTKQLVWVTQIYVCEHREIFYLCSTWCGSWGSFSETIILPFPW